MKTAAWALQPGVLDLFIHFHPAKPLFFFTIHLSVISIFIETIYTNSTPYCGTRWIAQDNKVVTNGVKEVFQLWLLGSVMKKTQRNMIG